MFNPYYADFDPETGEAAVLEYINPTGSAVIWRLAGHTTLPVAEKLAEQMNRALQAAARDARRQAMEDFR